MSPEAQRIAIAEKCGWSDIESSELCGWPMGKPPDGLPERKGGMAILAVELPDYLNDLNAMHEAEKTLPPLAPWNYRDILQDMVIATQGPDGAHQSTHFVYGATAAQRAEAFLRTIGKWVD